MNHPIRVLLVDDQPSIRQGLRMHLSCTADIAVAGEACDGATAIELASELAPDVVVMDASMPGMDGIEATRRIHAVGGPAIVVLSLKDDAASRARAIDAGAVAFVSKNEANGQLVEAIRCASTRPAAEPDQTGPGQLSTGGA